MLSTGASCFNCCFVGPLTCLKGDKRVKCKVKKKQPKKQKNKGDAIAGLIDEDKLAQCSKLVSVAPKWPNYALLYLDR